MFFCFQVPVLTTSTSRCTCRRGPAGGTRTEREPLLWAEIQICMRSILFAYSEEDPEMSIVLSGTITRFLQTCLQTCVLIIQLCAFCSYTFAVWFAILVLTNTDIITIINVVRLLSVLFLFTVLHVTLFCSGIFLILFFWSGVRLTGQCWGACQGGSFGILPCLFEARPFLWADQPTGQQDCWPVAGSGQLRQAAHLP